MSAPITVAVNASWLQPGRVGGTETYARRLLHALVATDPGLTLHVVAGPAAIEALASTIDGITWRRLPRPTDSRTGRVLVERTLMPRHLDDIGADADHHLGGTVPGRARRPTIVTIHDLQPLDDPGNFGSLKQRWLAHAIPRAVIEADVVATPSEWVARTVIDRFGLDPERVLSVPVYAADIERDDAGTTTASDRVRAILDRGPVVLYPAMTMAHKNHALLFRAFDRAVGRRPELRLVCVGPPGRDHSAVTALAADHSSQIHLLGYVSADDLDVLYREAEMLVFPSRYEGFGLPILEAQRASLPVVASAVTAIPEVAGDGARLVDPDDVDAWADVLADPPTGSNREDLIAAGRANVSRYSAERTARAQIDAYRLAIDRHRAS